MSGNTKKKEQNADGVFDKKGVRSKQDTLDLVHFVYEAQLTRMETCFHKIFILCLVLIVLLFGTNIAWFAYSANTKAVDTSNIKELDNTGKMIALKPIQFIDKGSNEIEIELNEDDDERDFEKAKYPVVKVVRLAIAC